MRKHCRVEPLKWAACVVFRHWLPISSSRACKVGGSAELAQQNFSTAGHAHRFVCAPSGPCPARVCKPSRSLRRRGAACLSARACVPRRSRQTVPYLFERWGQIIPLPKSARTTFEPMHASRGVRIKLFCVCLNVGGKSVRFQNHPEPLSSLFQLQRFSLGFGNFSPSTFNASASAGSRSVGATI